MIPKREQFILDVRKAVKAEQKPIVITDSEMVNPDALSKVLSRAALWLTPKTVEAYDPQAFPDNGVLHEDLQQAVRLFRETAAGIPAAPEATSVQFRQGIDALNRLSGALRKIVLAEWTSAVEEIVKQVEQWSKELGWPARREMKKLNESLLEDYSLPQLHFFADGYLHVLDPLARFAHGTLGSFDLSIQPSFYMTSIFRDFDGIWYVTKDLADADAHATGKEVLTKHTFKRAVAELRSLL